MKITVAGNLIVDKIKLIDDYPQPSMLCNIIRMEQGIGGCAANTGAALKRLWPAGDISIAGMVGDDADGAWLCNRLRQLGLDISHIHKTDAAPTSFTDVFTERKTGRRTFFHSRGANALFERSLAAEAAQDVQMFHIGYALLLDALDAPNDTYGTELAALLAKLHQSGIQTSMDLVSENSDRFTNIVRPSLPWCDHLIINENEAEMLSGKPVRTENGTLCADLLQAVCETLMAFGVHRNVIIHAPEAACMLTQTGKFAFMPSLTLPKGYIKGAVGAGDTFCAASLACIAQNKEPEFILRAASCAAACNLSCANSIDGVRTLTEALQLEHDFPRDDTVPEYRIHSCKS